MQAKALYQEGTYTEFSVSDVTKAEIYAPTMLCLSVWVQIS
jgi:hypothetical protein